MNCEKAQNLLAEYRSDLLGPRARRKVEEHLAGCERCAHELRVLDATIEMVEAEVRSSAPPPGLWNGVLNRISSPRAEPGGRGFSWRPARALGAAAAVAAVGLGIALGTVHFRPPAPAMQRASADNRYVQAHAYQVSHAPLADRVSYVSLLSLPANDRKGEQHR